MAEMPPSIEKKLNDIQGTLKHLYEEVARERRIRENEKSLTPQFLENSPSERSLRDRIYKICDEISETRGRHPRKRELLIMGFFDQAILPKLEKILSVGVKIRIISHKVTTSRNDQTNLDALKRMDTKGAEVRSHPMLHARIFCVNDEYHGQVIIGSGDIKSDSLGGRHFDAGIWSNHPDIVSSTLDFFNRVWEDERVKLLSEIG